jgi:predicted nucleic acid-binding protein
VITAVDTSVLLDVFGADPTFGVRSRDAVRQCIADGSLIACDIVWAEVAANFPSGSAARDAMARLGVGFGPLDRDAALAAGAAWRLYRARGGSRARVIADFLIGAHALAHAARLLTRDRGFFRSYFRTLVVLDPTAE